jgi:hypothetical protein
MKVLTAPLTAVPGPFIRPRFHVARAATRAVEPDAERQPRSPTSRLVRFLWGRAGTPEEEAARAEALAIKARDCSLVGWRLY